MFNVASTVVLIKNFYFQKSKHQCHFHILCGEDKQSNSCKHFVLFYMIIFIDTSDYKHIQMLSSSFVINST